MNKPILTEPGVKYYLSKTLHECRKFKNKNINIIYNLSIFFIVFGVIGSFLYFNYNGNAKPEEIKFRERQKQEYILSKLQQLASIRKTKSQNTFTNLPTF